MTFLKVLISGNICVYLPPGPVFSPEETQADGRHLGDDLPGSRRSAHPHPLPLLSRVQHWTEVHLLWLLHWQNHQWVSPGYVILGLPLIFTWRINAVLMCTRVIKGTWYTAHVAQVAKYVEFFLSGQFMTSWRAPWSPDCRAMTRVWGTSVGIRTRTTSSAAPWVLLMQTVQLESTCKSLWP